MDKKLGYLSYVKEYVTVLVAVFSLGISIYNWNVQRTFQNKYSHSVNKLLLDSTRLEIKDLDILYEDVDSSKSNPVTRSEFEVALNSLQHNYLSLSNIKLTDISEKERLTYQIFSNDLFNTYSIVNESFKTVFTTSEQIDKKMTDTEKEKLNKVKAFSDQIFISDEQRSVLLDQLASCRVDALWNISQLENGKYVTSDTLKQDDALFSKKYRDKKHMEVEK